MTVESNNIAPCYIRPIALRGYGEMGVNPKGSPIEVYIANYPWGKYVAGDAGGMCASRVEPAGAEHDAVAGEGGGELYELAADSHGGRHQRLPGGDCAGCEWLPERGVRGKCFLVRNGVIYTPPLSSSALSGITRDSVLTLARHFGIPVVEQAIPREMLYIADEAFFTGTAAEVTPIRSVDRIQIADGEPGAITKQLKDEFWGSRRG
jgi:branched-chain amino acid aminotransferase